MENGRAAKHALAAKIAVTSTVACLAGQESFILYTSVQGMRFGKAADLGSAGCPNLLQLPLKGLDIRHILLKNRCDVLQSCLLVSQNLFEHTIPSRLADGSEKGV